MSFCIMFKFFVFLLQIKNLILTDILYQAILRPSIKMRRSIPNFSNTLNCWKSTCSLGYLNVWSPLTSWNKGENIFICIIYLQHNHRFFCYHCLNDLNTFSLFTCSSNFRLFCLFPFSPLVFGLGKGVWASCLPSTFK